MNEAIDYEMITLSDIIRICGCIGDYNRPDGYLPCEHPKTESGYCSSYVKNRKGSCPILKMARERSEVTN